MSNLRLVQELIRKLSLGLSYRVLQIAVTKCADAKGVDRPAHNPELAHLGYFGISERCQSEFAINAHESSSK